MIRLSVARSARAGRWGYVLALMSGMALLWGRDVQPEEAPRAPAPVSAGVLTEHRPLAAIGPPGKSVGEDCTTYGRAECLSGLCLHVRARRDGGYVCSQVCREPGDCPEGWQCRHLMPGGSEDGVCQPPAGWSSSR
jgi:hypothetical protein